MSGDCLLLSDKIHNSRDGSRVKLKRFTDKKEPVPNQMLRDYQICHSAPVDQANLTSKVTCCLGFGQILLQLTFIAVEPFAKKSIILIVLVNSSVVCRCPLVAFSC